jgi:hypothetical protein
MVKGRGGCFGFNGAINYSGVWRDNHFPPREWTDFRVKQRWFQPRLKCLLIGEEQVDQATRDLNTM